MSILCPVIESVEELKKYKMVPNQHNIVFIKLGTLLAIRFYNSW